MDAALMPGEHLRITPDTYRTHDRHRELADRVMAALHYDPRDVMELRLCEATIQVDVLQRTRATSSERLVSTHIYGLGQLGG